MVAWTGLHLLLCKVARRKKTCWVLWPPPSAKLLPGDPKQFAAAMAGGGGKSDWASPNKHENLICSCQFEPASWLGKSGGTHIILNPVRQCILL